MEDTKPKAASSDEIDLSQVFRWIGNGFRNFGNSILGALASLRLTFFKNKLFFTGIILLGLGIGSSYSELLKKKFYKSAMVLSCDYLNRRIVEGVVEKLNLLSEEEDPDGLAQELGVDPIVAKGIRKFEAEAFVDERDIVEIEVLKEQLSNVAQEKKDIVDKVISKVELENKQAFQISVQVYDPEIVKDLETAVINYFKSNEYIKRRIEINKENLLRRKEKLVRESKKLDSLKLVLFQNFETMAKQSREGSNNVILSDKYLTDPLSVFTQDLSINQQILDIEHQLYIQPDFEVIDGFTSFKEPESASLVKILAISFLASWIMGYLILGLWRFDRFLANYYPEK